MSINSARGRSDGAMSGKQDGPPALTGAAQRGLLKLMVKLPSVRGQLQVIAGRQSSFRELLAAYDEATAMLERLERGQKRDEEMIAEYRNVCSGIESDVIAHCLNFARDR